MLRGLDFILRAAGAMEDFWPGSERSTVHFRKMEKQQEEFGTISQVKAHRGSGSNQEMLRKQTQFSRDWMLRAERQSRPRKKGFLPGLCDLRAKADTQKGLVCRRQQVPSGP